MGASGEGKAGQPFRSDQRAPIDLADTRLAFPRALRLPGPLDVTPVREHVAALARTTAGPSTVPDLTRADLLDEHSMSQHR